MGYCRGKVTTDVLIGELRAGPLLQGAFRGESRSGGETQGFTQVRPLDEVKTYSCFSLLDVEFSITRVQNRYLCLKRF